MISLRLFTTISLVGFIFGTNRPSNDVFLISYEPNTHYCTYI